MKLILVSFCALIAGCGGGSGGGGEGGTSIIAPRFVYVANYGSNNISGFAINSTTGALNPVAVTPVNSCTGPRGIAISPLKDFVYVVCQSAISVYAMSQSTGTLTQVPFSPFAGPAGFIVSVRVHPNGKFVYFGGVNGAGILVAYSINQTTGFLTPLAGNPVPAPAGISSIAISADGGFLYAAGSGGAPYGVAVYSINSTTGALVQSPGGVATSNLGSQSKLELGPRGEFLYLADNNNPGRVLGFSVNTTTGALTALGLFPADSNLSDFKIAPVGTFAYGSSLTTGTSSTLTTFVPGGDGSFTSSTSVTLAAGLIALAITPDGKNLYAVNNAANYVLGYSVNTGTGSISQLMTPFATGTNPYDIAVSP